MRSLQLCCLIGVICLVNGLPSFIKHDLMILNHKTSKGCEYNGQHYKPGGAIKPHNDCVIIRCSPDGKVIKRNVPNCLLTTTPLPTTTNEPTTTTPLTTPFGCFYENKHYAPGEVINEGYDENSNWCYGSYCDEDGQILMWDNWNCKPTTEPPTTTTPPIPTTFPQGCYYRGKYYQPGDKITTNYDLSSNWCNGKYCGSDGMILMWDNWNCKPTTEPPTTTTPPMPTTFPQGCYYRGKYYQPGDKIMTNYDPSSNWCHGKYCGSDGMILMWDKWNCKPTTEPPTTTTPPMPTTTPQ